MQTSTTGAVCRVGMLLYAALGSGCEGPQSALDPAGAAGERLADLFVALTVGAAIIWCTTVGLALYAAYSRRKPFRETLGAWLIVGGGVVVPVVVLGATLTHGLALLNPLLPRAADGSLEIEVIGEQWWWRVRYPSDTGEPVELANELRLPVGRPVELSLSSDNVIHSFWIPPLGGKADMIPGRQTRLALTPTRVGEYRGVCAEFCGASHALMAFRVVVLEPEAFDDWLAAQRAPAATSVDQDAADGAAGFLRNGCGACHTIRGTPAAGTVGPDLTHVGSRLSLAAGMLPNDAAAFARWIALTGELKPSVHMPAFGMLPPAEIEALAAYLEALQ